MATQLEIANLALRRMGHVHTITSNETSQENSILTDVWDFVRKDALDRHAWDFATFQATIITGQKTCINLVGNSLYRWLASADGTGNYYLDLSGGGDPALVKPISVEEGGTPIAEGTLGALTASQWAFGDSTGDGLGYSTIYIRLADDADPDSKTSGHVGYIADLEWDYIYTGLPSGHVRTLYIINPVDPNDRTITFDTRGDVPRIFTNHTDASIDNSGNVNDPHLTIKYIEDKDDPTDFSDRFANALAWRLAAEFAAVLTGDLNRQNAMMSAFEATFSNAKTRDARNSKSDQLARRGRGLIAARRSGGSRT